MKIIVVHASNPEAKGLLRPLVDRIMDFCIAYESEADPDILYEEVMKSYLGQNPAMAFFVAVDDNGKVRAHLVAVIEYYFGSKSVSVLQYWKDKGVSIPNNLKADVLGSLKAWGEASGATRFRIYARTEDVAKIFERNYGFQRDRKVMMNAPLNAFEEKLCVEEEGVRSGFRNSGDSGRA